MAKNIPTANIDLMLAIVEGTNIHVCSAEPTTYTEAVTTFNIATDTVGTYTKAAGDVSGRKNTQAGTTATSITTSGTATHVAITTTTGSVLELVTTATPQLLTSGGTVDIGSFAHEIEQAV